MIRFVRVVVGDGGGAACSHCAGMPAAAEHRPTEDVVADIVAAAEGWSGGPGPNVSLSGAEPFAHPELPAIVAAAVEAGVARLRAETDAVALQSAGNAGGSVAAGLRHVRVRLLGGTPGVHDALTGSPGRFDALTAGARTFVAAAREQEVDACVTVEVPVCRHNVRDLPAAVAHAACLGAASVTLLLTDGGLDVDGAREWLRAACDTGVVNGTWVEVDGLPACLLPGGELHLADAVRERPGDKAPVCAECALDLVCAGACAGASAEMLAALRPPADAEALAGRFARSRGLG